MKNRTPRIIASVLALFLLAGMWFFLPSRVADLPIATDADTIAKGEYLVHAAGCISCHISSSQPPALSGGLALPSPFGSFYVPNITPDPSTGIGGWSGRDLLAAIKHGRSPDGRFYFPAFPYRSYAGMTDEDAMAIAAWLMAQEPVIADTADHELPAPEWLARLAMGPWNRLADMRSVEFPSYEDEDIRRGAYLARHLGHCGECHTPRDRFGIPDLRREFAGAPLADGEAEAIDAAAMHEWTEQDFSFFLFLGLKPDEDYVGGEMEPVIEYNTSPLTEADRNALAAFFIRGQ
ncbi:MAG: hypothetical protein RLZZ385_1014 [Pseudomonadota bacterium]|jgi:mono/diheme cytochrome c family protein